MNLRVKPEMKARLILVAAPCHTDLTEFVTRTALCEAEEYLSCRKETVSLSLICLRTRRRPMPNCALLLHDTENC
ncbi:MAG: DUF1778 domain-containing protein [Syntrophobacterales bacterium]|nr:DUF1778 domain-containing protein [Syntrophobacterales bacterium]